MLQEENSPGWASLSAGCLKSGPDAHWPFCAHSGHPLHSQTLIYELQLVYLYLVDLLVQQLKERVVQTNFSLTENPISHCLTVFCSNLVSVQINPNRTEILAQIPKLRALTLKNNNRNDNDRKDNKIDDDICRCRIEPEDGPASLVAGSGRPAPCSCHPAASRPGCFKFALNSIICFSILSDFFWITLVHVLILRLSWKSMSR